MANKVLLDNWLLQEVTNLLLDGPSLEAMPLVSVDRSSDSHVLREVARAGIQAEALINLLVDVVLRDQVVVDEQFAIAWADRDGQVHQLHQAGLLGVVPIDNRTERARRAKSAALDELCATTSLRTIQTANEQSFREHGEAADKYFSIVMWGAAGNLGRSAESELPYAPHPARRQLMGQTVFRQPTAVDEVQEWLRQERIAIYARDVPGGQFRHSNLLLPPFVLQILDGASSIGDLVSVALQVREEYAKLREWIGEFQAAMDAEDGRAILKRRRLLDSVSQYVGQRTTDAKFGATGLSINAGFFSFSVPIPGPGNLIQRWGMRGTLNRLVLSPAGGAATNKLLKLLGEDTSSLGAAIRSHLDAVYSPAS